MSRWIDADTLIDALDYDIAIDEDILNYVGTEGIQRTTTQFDKDCKQNAIELLLRTPSIEIVFCKECERNYNKTINHGKMHPICDFVDCKLTENDFCSHGKRKESE